MRCVVLVVASVWALAAAAAAAAQPTAAGPSTQTASGGDAAALPQSELYRVEPQRVDEAPGIDGRLDEPAWQTAAIIDTFTQQEPAEGEPATERTVVRLLYDARACISASRRTTRSPGA